RSSAANCPVFATRTGSEWEHSMDWEMRLQQAPGLEINEGTDGFLVYEPSRDRLHNLNASAMLVLESCDGARHVGDLPALVADAFGLAVPPDDDVAAC